MSKKSGGFLLGAVIGGAAAAVAALLVAPKSGKQTRKELLDQVEDLKASDYGQKAIEKGEKALQKAQELKNATVSSLKKQTAKESDEKDSDKDWEARLNSLVDDSSDIVVDMDLPVVTHEEVAVKEEEPEIEIAVDELIESESKKEEK